MHIIWCLFLDFDFLSYLVFFQGKGKVTFPSAARRMDTLNDLLAASDVISLHCAVTDETIQIINAECLQHIKPGILIPSHSTSQAMF